MATSAGDVAEFMFELIKSSQGQKQFRPTELTKEAIAKFGAENCDKKICKQALRELTDSGRCVYTFYGGSFVELPHKEGASPDS